ncbi:MAG: WbqC family protein [Nitrospirota bacterium]
MMKLAIMQPYLFPYIGYFQLINAVDKFVIYDDVNFIKQGWINRNRILVGGKEFVFTIPVRDQSSFKLIKNTLIDDNKKWAKRIIKTIEQSYKQAPYFYEIIEMITKVFHSDVTFINELALMSIMETCCYLNIETEVVSSSGIYDNAFLKGQERVLDICRRENADLYINPIGGLQLYSKDGFKEHNIDLAFLQPRIMEYNQLNDKFVPGLSIIDVMMFNSKEKIREWMSRFELI